MVNRIDYRGGVDIEAIKDLEQKIVQWAKDRNIYQKSTSTTRLEKLQEEVGELKDEVNLEFTHGGRFEAIKMEAGDVLVSLKNLIHPFGLDFEACLSAAYEKIKDRTGKMENGTFVKDTPEDAGKRGCDNCHWQNNDLSCGRDKPCI